jgi:hypothetical protein
VTTMPDWVPEGVKRAAADFDQSKIAHRLTHDPRMEGVWNQIMASERRKRPRHQVIEAAIADLPTDKRCGDETNLSDQDKAAAALFLTFVGEMTNNTILTKRSRRETIDIFKRTAELCRTQRLLSYAPEIALGLENQNPSRNTLLAKSLNDTASYFERLSALFASTKGLRWGVNEKAEIKRSRIQAQMSEIIIVVDKLYTPKLRATLRHIANIGFAIKVDDKDIDNWRSMSSQVLKETPEI